MSLLPEAPSPYGLVLGGTLNPNSLSLTHSHSLCLRLVSLFFKVVVWMVGCFGFNGPLRQYFSLYRAVSQREGERRERIDESKNVQTTPTRTYCKHNRPLPYCNQNCRTPRHWKFTQHHRTTRPPLQSSRNLCWERTYLSSHFHIYKQIKIKRAKKKKKKKNKW